MLQKMKKNSCTFEGPPLCGTPVRPNMLNMPKSASESECLCQCSSVGIYMYYGINVFIVDV